MFQKELQLRISNIKKFVSEDVKDLIRSLIEDLESINKPCHWSDGGFKTIYQIETNKRHSYVIDECGLIKKPKYIEYDDWSNELFRYVNTKITSGYYTGAEIRVYSCNMISRSLGAEWISGHVTCIYIK